MTRQDRPILLLDLLFLIAYVGLVASIVGIAGRALFFLAGGSESPEVLVVLALTFWTTVVLWSGFTIGFLKVSGAACARRESGDAAQLWDAILRENKVVCGPTAFYFGWYRSHTADEAASRCVAALSRSRSVMDVLCFLSTWGWPAGMAAVAVGFFLGSVFQEMLVARVLAAAALALFAASSIATFAFASLLLMHAGVMRQAHRPEGPLNPVAWVVDLRRYYLEYLRGGGRAAR